MHLNLDALDLLTSSLNLDSPTYHIGKGDGLTPADVIKLSLSLKLSHILQNSNTPAATELEASRLMLTAPEKFLTYPASSILNPGAAGEAFEKEYICLNKEFNRLEQKSQIISELHGVLNRILPSESLSSDAALIADELFTNALFDAPFQAQTSGPVERNSESLIAANVRPARIFAAHDKKRLVIGCEDTYGTLNSQAVLARVQECFEKGVRGVLQRNVGGGIGVYLVFSTGTALFAGVKTGKKSIVCATLPLVRSSKMRATMGKNLHHFEIS